MGKKNIIITGANAGIGLATARALAAQQHNLFLVCRTAAKAQEAIANIKAETGNENIEYFVCELSSQKSVRQLAADIHKRLTVVDVLINNAGAVYQNFERSEDDIEMTMATNHFGPFLLTNLMLDLLKKSPEARIINVASDAHYGSAIDFESFTRNKGYFVFKAYGQSKLANVLFTVHLAALLKDSTVTVNALHPGVVRTHIGNKGVSRITSWVWSLFTAIRGINVAEGAETSVFLATAPEVKGISGKYFDKCREKKPSAAAADPELAARLWQKSAELCPLQ